MILLLMILLLGVIWMEVPGLVQKKMRRELIAFSVFMLAASALSISHMLGITIPGPDKPIEALFKPFVEWIMK